jgi:predicted nucleic acid-binding protein
MTPSVYVESTIPSFVVGEMSPVIVTAAHQIATRQWWGEHRQDYRLYISRLVVQEISRGEPKLSRQRLALVADLPQLVIVDRVLDFARELRTYLGLAHAAEQDAIHLAVASHYRIDYLLTWNLAHLANGHVRRAIDRFHARRGTYFPTICTPDELMGSENEYD